MNYWFRLPLRTRLGIIATILMIVAGVSVFLASRDPVHHRPLYSVIKFAPILFLFWLAWVDLKNLPLWIYLVAPPVIIFCCIKPAAWFIVIPVALTVLFVLPKK